MKIALAVFLFSLPVFGKLAVSIHYDIAHGALKGVEEQLVKCQKRDYPQYACAVRPFKGANEDLVLISCGRNLPDKEGNGCELNFFGKEKMESGVFRFGLTKGLSLSVVQKSLASIQQQLASAGNGYQHLNFGNPFHSAAEGLNYVCERKSEKDSWSCYLDVVER